MISAGVQKLGECKDTACETFLTNMIQSCSDVTLAVSAFDEADDRLKGFRSFFDFNGDFTKGNEKGTAIKKCQDFFKKQTSLSTSSEFFKLFYSDDEAKKINLILANDTPPAGDTSDEPAKKKEAAKPATLTKSDICPKDRPYIDPNRGCVASDKITKAPGDEEKNSKNATDSEKTKGSSKWFVRLEASHPGSDNGYVGGDNSSGEKSKTIGNYTGQVVWAPSKLFQVRGGVTLKARGPIEDDEGSTVMDAHMGVYSELDLLLTPRLNIGKDAELLLLVGPYADVIWNEHLVHPGHGNVDKGGPFFGLGGILGLGVDLSGIIFALEARKRFNSLSTCPEVSNNSSKQYIEPTADVGLSVTVPLSSIKSTIEKLFE